MSRPDDPTDLPLFSWRPPECQVIVFPVAKRVGRIRRLAAQMHGTTAKGATAVWRKAAGDLQRSLHRAGASEDVIERESLALFDAVQAELVRLDYGGARRPRGDGAA